MTVILLIQNFTVSYSISSDWKKLRIKEVINALLCERMQKIEILHQYWKIPLQFLTARIA
ncbi:unknown [Alistipes sp. CAG:831]|nr:unknown [Alistipes sp. CAG:831]